MSSVKGAYESELINSFGPKDEYIKSISGQNSIPTILSFRAINATSVQEKASSFNSYFHSVFTQSNFSIPPVR